MKAEPAQSTLVGFKTSEQITRTEPAQVKYTKRLKAAQCCVNIRICSINLAGFITKRHILVIQKHSDSEVYPLFLTYSMCTHDDSRISFFLCCVELRFSSDTGIVEISENNHVASPPSR